MDYAEKFGFYNNCLYIKEAGVCVASDLHIGMEDELRRQGLAFPLKEEELLIGRLRAVVEKFEPRTFVLNGDIFHSFDRADRKVRDKFARIMRLLRKRCQVVLVKGSHDTMLAKLFPEAQDRYDIEGFAFAHGHEVLQDFGTLIMGHEHPVIGIEMERLPCFLLGQKILGGKDLVITPAFNPLCQGVTINHVEGRDFLSPILKRIDTGELAPVVELEGEVMAFPKLHNLRRHID